MYNENILSIEKTSDTYFTFLAEDYEGKTSHIEIDKATIELELQLEEGTLDSFDVEGTEEVVNAANNIVNDPRALDLWQYTDEVLELLKQTKEYNPEPPVERIPPLTALEKAYYQGWHDAENRRLEEENKYFKGMEV